MRKFTLAICAVTLAIAGGSGAVDAQTAPARHGLDADGDGLVSWAEFNARAADGFARLDINHDGVIDRSEREQMRNQRPHELEQSKDGSTGQGGSTAQGTAGHVPGASHGGGMGGAMMFLRGADTNHDGKITRAEYDASVKAHFDAMDTNHDGRLSKDERRAARAKMRAEMQARMRERGDGMDDMRHGSANGTGGDDMPPPPQ